MTIHRLTAGAGYRYLVRTTASGDVARSPEQSLTAYYTATGTPPGRWHGEGLTGLDDGRGLGSGTVVDEASMAALFGSGHDPVTGQPLGRAFPVYTTTTDRIAGRVARLPGALTKEQRDTLTEQITAEEVARPTRSPVAGFDLTFTVPKSVSVLWALADPGVQAQIAAAHHQAVAATLAVLEDSALFTRIGAQSCAQVATRGAVAAGFDHVDTRAGDPNLHTHLVIANKVQGPDGAWRAVDSRALFTAAVALSETYDSLLADHLTTRLGVRWAWRERGRNRSAAYEITGLDDDLLTVFSTRSAAITARVAELIGQQVAATGRRPTRAQVLQLRQRATLDTRPAKTHRALADQMASWRHRAIRSGHDPEEIVQRVLQHGRLPVDSQSGLPVPDLGPRVDEATLAGLAGDVLAGLIERRATWTRWNALAETARATRHLRFPTATRRLAVHDRIVAVALAACVSLDPEEPYTVPAAYRRPDGTSVFTRSGAARYTHPIVLAAEQRLLDAHADTSAPTAPAPACTHPAAGGVPLAPDQARAVRTICGSGRRLEVLVGPAGSGKTAALRALRHAWEATCGPGTVIGLAPSATAARELAHSLGIPCENTAKWLHETHPTTPGTWRMRPGQLVIVDEASLACTHALDALAGQARDADAKLLLVGDHHQLGPVDTGGAFAQLAEDGQPLELESLWRFTHAWEAHATLLLRAGDDAVLDTYDARGRLHEGTYEHMLERAYQAWTQDNTTGAASVLLAADRATVAVLNQRARTDRLTAGTVAAEGVTTGDGTTIGVGDRVVTRHNDRRLTLPTGDYVRNGTLWDVTHVGPDGSLTVTPTGTPRAGAVTLPQDYMQRHVDLGYALTIHRAQGITVDTAHLITTAAMRQEALYVGLTRGRNANHAYTATDTPFDGQAHPEGPPGADDTPTGREVLAGILANPGTEQAATTILRTAAEDVISPERLRPIAATLTADIVRRRWVRLITRRLDHNDFGVTRRLCDGPAAGTLHAALARAEAAGHSPSVLLDRLAEALTRPPGSTAARESTAPDDDALRRLARVIDHCSDRNTPPGPVDPRDPLRHRPIADPGDPASAVLRELQQIVDARLSDALGRRPPMADEVTQTPEPYAPAPAPAPTPMGPNR